MHSRHTLLRGDGVLVGITSGGRDFKVNVKIPCLQGIRTQIVKSNSPLREPNNDILAVEMV